MDIDDILGQVVPIEENPVGILKTIRRKTNHPGSKIPMEKKKEQRRAKNKQARKDRRKNR